MQVISFHPRLANIPQIQFKDVIELLTLGGEIRTKGNRYEIFRER